MIKIKKGVNPVGTTQLIRQQVPTKFAWHKYNVIEVTGSGNFTPSEDGPIIWMELAEKNPGMLQQFISLPLSVFHQRVLPNEKADKFWEGKGAEVETGEV